jgi:hypothetical protein
MGIKHTSRGLGPRDAGIVGVALLNMIYLRDEFRLIHVNRIGGLPALPGDPVKSTNGRY